MKSFCSSLLLLPVLMFSSLSAQECRPKIAIKTFANPANYARSTIGNGLTEILTTELQNTGKFNILERSNIDEATKEMDFGTTDYAKGDTFARKGNLLGAQYLLMGKVTNFSYSETGQRKQKINLLGPNTIVIEYQQRADVRVDFRLIKVATGETVLSQAGDAHSTAKSEVSEYGLFQRVIAGVVTLESSSSLIGRATTDAIRDIVSKLNSLHEMVECGDDPWVEKLSSANPTIVAEEGGGLWIFGGIGSADGLRVGDRLLVKHDNGVKDKSGKIIYHKLVDVGQMEVTDVGQADHAEARFTADADAGGRVPQVNDPATVDMEHAKQLRGARGTQTDHRTDVTANKEQLEQSIKRAESYMRDRFWSQALDEYKHAAALSPGDVRVLAGQALSHYALGDFVEGEGIAEKLIQSDGALTFPIAHYHGMNLCTGQLTSAFPMGDSEIRDMQKFEDSVVQLIHKFVR